MGNASSADSKLDEPMLSGAGGRDSGSEHGGSRLGQSEMSDATNKLSDLREYHDGKVWVNDLADEYDYCIVFPPQKPGVSHYLEDYTSRLAELGLEMFCYKEKQGKGNLFVLVRAPVSILRTYADQNNFNMLMDESFLEIAANTGFPPQIKPIDIAHLPSIINYRPYEFIYCKYSQRVDEQLYYREPGDHHPFQRDVIRLKILSLLMESRPVQGGENLKFKRYLRFGRILGIFPLHDSVKKKSLAHTWMPLTWACLFPWKMPFLLIKEYMGEKIGLYYVFQGHYNRFLLVPAIVGVPVQIAVFYYSKNSIYDGFNDAPFLPFYSFFVSLWAIFMLEFWKRRENRMALEWGMSGQEEHDVPQPEFRGERIKSFINGESNYLHFPTSTRSSYLLQSSMAITGLTILVLGLVAATYKLKAYLESQGLGASDAQTTASVLNSIQIQVANWAYTFIANELTNRENHRTQAKYDDALVVKIFVFQFINSFASFFYLAFLSEVITDSPNCSEYGCMYSLSLNLVTIFVLRLVTQQVTGLFIPWLVYKYKVAGGAVRELIFSNKPSSLSRPELEFLLEPYSTDSQFVDDMMDAVIQFGFMSLFVTAFPGTAALALLSNIIGLKGKAWKLINIHQRPTPVAAEDIGQFQSLLLITAIIAVITNAALTVFTMSVLDTFSEGFRFWIFIGFQWICFSAQAIIMEAIPDEPESIVFHKRRSAHLESKLIDRVEDDVIETFGLAGRHVVVQEYPKTGGYFKLDPAAAEAAAVVKATLEQAERGYSVDVIPPSAAAGVNGSPLHASANF